MPFQDLPALIISAVFDKLSSEASIVLSTCHSSLLQYGRPSHIKLRPRNKCDITSFGRWLSKKPGVVKTLYFDGAMDLVKPLEDIIASPEQKVRKYRGPLSWDGFAHLSSIEEGVISCPVRPSASLRDCKALKSLVLLQGIECSHLDEGIADLMGIATAPHLTSLTIVGQRGRVCLCMLPDLKHLKHLEIRGVAECPCVVSSLLPLRSLPGLRHLVVDSSSLILHESVLEHLKALETLDAGTGRADTVFPRRRVFGYLEKLPNLRVFGCNDLRICTPIPSRIVEYRTCLTAFVLSIRHDGFVVPRHVRHLVIRGAFSRTFHVRNVVRCLNTEGRATTLHLTLKDEVGADMVLAEMAMELWFRVATEVGPMVRFHFRQPGV